MKGRANRKGERSDKPPLAGGRSPRQAAGQVKRVEYHRQALCGLPRDMRRRQTHGETVAAEQDAQQIDVYQQEKRVGQGISDMQPQLSGCQPWLAVAPLFDQGDDRVQQKEEEGLLIGHDGQHVGQEAEHEPAGRLPALPDEARVGPQ